MALDKCNSINICDGSYLITADTIVTAGRKIFHKTNKREVARENLLALSGRRHTVYTAFCVKKGSLVKENVVKTILKMKRLSTGDIDSYLATKQWVNKAGSYSIQGEAIAFFPYISGCFSNVIGLPLPKLLNILKSMRFSPRKNVL